MRKWLQLLYEAFDLWNRQGDGSTGSSDPISELGNE